jgi:hypothetical protein
MDELPFLPIARGTLECCAVRTTTAITGKTKKITIPCILT